MEAHDVSSTASIDGSHVNFFREADELEADPHLPWAASCWIDGDSLAPPCGSQLEVVDELLKLARCTSIDTVLDLGAGDGRVCIHAALSFKARALGIEIDSSECRKFSQNIERFGLQGSVVAIEGDLMRDKPKLEKVTIIAVYLLPEAIGSLREFFDGAITKGIRVVMNTWGLPWREAQKTARVGSNQTPIFLYSEAREPEN